MASFVMGYHGYNILKSTMKEILETRMEPDNLMDKSAVAVIKSETVVRHKIKRKTGRFAKQSFASRKQAQAISVLLKLLAK